MNSNEQWYPPMATEQMTPGVQRYQRSQALRVRTAITYPGTNRVILGPRIGSVSAFGQVYMVSDGKYVLKQMDITNPRDQRIFNNEVYIGSIPAISVVGPKIFTWRKFKTQTRLIGQYVMNNFGETISLEQYLDGACPNKQDPIYRLLKEQLTKFWKITKGYHGDLHMGNIHVKVGTNGKAIKIIIFDYGAHKRFKNLRPSNYNRYCFEDYIQTIQKQFQISYNKKQKIGSVSFYPHPNVPVIQPKGQPYRSNVNMLSKLNKKRNLISQIKNRVTM